MLMLPVQGQHFENHYYRGRDSFVRRPSKWKKEGEGFREENRGSPQGESKEGGDSLVVQWLGLHALNAEGLGSIPGQGTKIPQALQRSQKNKNLKKKKKESKEGVKGHSISLKGRSKGRRGL